MRQGICVWLTGLSGAGKTTIAGHLRTILVEETGKYVSLLDGDAVRQGLSSDLGFSPEDRRAHAMRVSYVASEIVKHNGLVIVALISPYQEVRDRARDIISPSRFLEVFVDTPLSTCQKRDPKGLYERVKRGEIKNFTGVDAPYEAPAMPHITIKTEATTPTEAADRIYEYIRRRWVDDVLQGGWCL